MTNKTQFSDYNKVELLKICDEFGTEVNPVATKAELVARLAEDGVEFSLYQSMHPELFDEVVVAEAPLVATTATTVTPVVASGNKLLLKMTRKNASYQGRGAEFSRSNPYALVAEEDAEYLINVIGGFQIALPSEAANYYK